MRWFRQFSKYVFCNIKQLVKSGHGRIVLGGLLVGLLYFPGWIGVLLTRAVEGAVSWFFVVAMLGFAFNKLWAQRQSIQALVSSEEDIFLGHALILCGVVAFPFCRFAIWPQSLAWLIVLVGIVLSSWGLIFFVNFKLPVILIALTVYPKLGVLSRMVWEFFFPTYFLENTMAAVAASALGMFGFLAQADGRFISFPEGSVEVGWGCNGLDMAITMAAAGFFLGLIHQQKYSKVLPVVLIAVALAFLANIPRLMLVTIAYVYWGQQWFQFWHGFWGGQLFAGVFSTFYFSIALKFFNPHRTV